MDHCENALCTLLQKHEWNSIWKSFNEGHFNTLYPTSTLFYLFEKERIISRQLFGKFLFCVLLDAKA